MPPAVQGRSPPHLGRPLEQARRRVIADRPQVGNVPDATVAGTLVVNGQGPLDLGAELMDRPEFGTACLHGSVISSAI